MSETILPSGPTDADDDAKPRPGRSVRQQLALFALALLLPIALFAGYAVWSYAATERTRIEAEAGELATSVALEMDRELTGIFASLDLMSGSANLESGDYASLRQQAVRLLDRQGLTTVLVAPDGQQLVNVRIPIGTALPRSSLRWNQAELASDRPFVSDLVVGQVTGAKQILAVLPVHGGGQLRSILSFSLPLERLQRLITEADAPAAYTVSIVDRANVIVARSVRAEEFIGKSATNDLIENTRGRQGSWTGTTADGTPVFGSYTRSRLSDYRVAVGIRFDDLRKPLWQSLSLFAALFTVIAGLSILLAVQFGQRIARPLSALAREAARLGQGKPVTAVSTGLSEADAVGTELAGASVKLRERESDLREANEEIQRFAYIVSHDLRSPLVNIMGFTTELEALRGDIFERLVALRRTAAVTGETDDELGRDFDEAIGFIKTSIAKMDRLINAILALSREGRRQFAPERVDMNAMMASIKGSLTVQAERADATVEAGPLPPLVVDRLATEQIFSNLVDNALKYLRRGVPGRVVVRGETRGRHMVYTVEDNGRGIDERDRERVFDLFRRSGVQDRPGEGIGLAHVRALVRRLGGSISLTSEPGRGSTFTVTLPRRAVGGSQRKAA